MKDLRIRQNLVTINKMILAVWFARSPRLTALIVVLVVCGLKTRSLSAGDPELPNPDTGPYTPFNEGSVPSPTGSLPLPGGGGGMPVDCEPSESGSDIPMGPLPMSPESVHLAVGHKRETAVDLHVPLTGIDFQLIREYSSSPLFIADTNKTGIVSRMTRASGAGWRFTFMENMIRRNESGQDVLVLHTAPESRHIFYPTNSNPNENQVWKAKGSTQQFLRRDYAKLRTLEFDSDDASSSISTYWNTFTLFEPGRWTRSYYKGPHDGSLDPPEPPGGPVVIQDQSFLGMLAQQQDAYGNSHNYVYKKIGRGI